MEEKLAIAHRGQTLCAIHRVVRLAPASLVVMAHGGPGGDKRGPLGLFDVLAETLETSLGLSSLRFDFRGCGESDGTPLDMTVRSRADELASVMSWARGHGYARTALVAESLGASVALLAERPEVDALVLLWPAVCLARTDLAGYFAPEKEGEPAEKGFIVDGGIPVCAEFVRECRELDLVPALSRVHVPTLIVHGDEDRCVPVDQARRVHELIPAVKNLVVVQGGGHSLGRPAERAIVLENTIRWLGKHLSR